MKLIFLSMAFTACFAACSAPPPPPAVKPSPSPTPLPVEAVRVEKVTNVSFSTYSKDWPVGWTWIDADEAVTPTPHDTKLRVLSVTVPKGKDLGEGINNAPRFVKAFEGDFEIETQTVALPKLNHQAAGLLIFQDQTAYLRLDRFFGGGREGVIMSIRDAEGLREIAFVPTDMDRPFLKLMRRGNVVRGSWRTDPKGDWQPVGETTAEFSQTVLAGLAAYNTAEPFAVKFTYIRLLPVR